MSSALNFVHSIDKCEQCYHYGQHVRRSILLPWPSGSKDSILKHQELDEFRREWDSEDHSNGLIYMERYKHAKRERDEERLLTSRYRQELDLLRQQLEETKDRLLATQLAYEELSNFDFSQFSPHPPPTVPALAPISQDVVDHPDYPLDDGGWLYPGTVDHQSSHPLSSSDWRDDEALASAMDPHADEDFEIHQQLEFMDDDQDFVQSESRPSFLNFGPAPEQCSRRPAFELIQCGGGGIDMVSPDPSPISSSPTSSLSESTSESGIFPPELPTTSGNTDFASFPDINRLSALMKAAHDSNDVDAIAKVKILVTEAHNTTRNKRTQAHAFLIQNWRSPIQHFQKPSASTSYQPIDTVPSPLSSPPLPISSAEREIYANYQSRLNAVTEGSNTTHPEIFVDASGLGIGFVYEGQWLAWNFRTGACLPGDTKHKNKGNKLDTTWSELLAAELGIRTLIAANVKSSPITIRSDNESVVKFLRDKVCPEKQGMEVIFRRILALCEENALDLRARWIWTKVNPADGPSRRVYPPASLQFRSWPVLPNELDELVCLA